MQATRVEGEREALFIEGGGDFVRLSGIVPDAYCFVFRASRDELFTNTDVEAGDLCSVKRS